MGLSCEFGSDYDTSDMEWWWTVPTYDFTQLATKRSRKCCSCSQRIAPGADVIRVARERNPADDIEERIHGDMVQLAPWFLCEACGGLAMALRDLEFCFDLGTGQSLKEQIAEYRANEAVDKARGGESTRITTPTIGAWEYTAERAAP